MLPDRISHDEEDRQARADTAEHDLALQQYDSPDRRAEELLRSLLTPAQWRDWVFNHRFCLRSQKGHLYTYCRDGDYNIYGLKKIGVCGCTYCGGERRGLYGPKFCVYAIRRHYCPPADNAIAMMLLLQGNEAHFLKKANVSSYSLTSVRTPHNYHGRI